MAKQPQPFSLQVAGHKNTIMQLDSSILKPTSKVELAFYSEIKRQNSPLLGITAEFCGEVDEFIKLEDFTFGLSGVSVLDVKVGAKLYGLDATEEKKARMEQQRIETTSGTCGLRICGMKVWNGVAHDSYDKSFGRSLNVDTIAQGFKVFFQENSNDICQAIEKLENIILVLKQVDCWFGGCSVLIIRSDQGVFVKMVDFAHSQFIDYHDTDVEDSILNLVDILMKML